MLRKLTDSVSYDLLPLLASLFIAVGMPLFHPILHSHSENHHIISEHCGEHVAAFADEDHELNCPICDFQATSQLYDAGMVRVIAKIKPADKIASIKNVFLAKTHPLQIEPRAPPAGNSL